MLAFWTVFLLSPRHAVSRILGIGELWNVFVTEKIARRREWTYFRGLSVFIVTFLLRIYVAMNFWLIDCSNLWNFDVWWRAACLIHWSLVLCWRMDRSIDRFIYRLNFMFVDWSIDFDWSFDFSVDWLIEWLAGFVCSIDRLIDWCRGFHVFIFYNLSVPYSGNFHATVTI